MSKDIRSYFMASPSSSKKIEKTSEKKNSRKRNVISSDEESEDLIYSSLANKKLKTTKNEDKSKDKSEKIVDKKPTVTTTDQIFGKKPVNRVAAKKVERDKNKNVKEKSDKEKGVKEKGVKEKVTDKKVATERLLKDAFDDDFEETLRQLPVEDEYLEHVTSKSKKVVNESMVVKDKSNKEKNHKENGEKPKKEKAATNKFDEIKEKLLNMSKEENGIKEKKRKLNTNIEIETKKEKEEEPDFVQEKVEKKKQNAKAYQSYLNRGGARNPGSKEIPTGAENCLLGLTFVVTGVLDSLEREEAEELIKQYGGQITKSVSKKTSYMVVGEEAGPSKLCKSRMLGIKELTEDEFLELIKTRPGKSDSKNEQKKKSETLQKPKNCKDPTETKSSPETKSRFFKEEQKIKSEEAPEITNRKEELMKVTEVKQKEPEIQQAKPQNEPKVESKVSKPTNLPTASPPSSDLLSALVEKHRPKEMKKIIGQNGDKSNAKKLYNWLNNWFKNRAILKKTKTKPSKDDTGMIYKAALLSGPPGIGKTTTATVVAKELGFDVLEFNASDTRSKKLLQEEIAGILTNNNVKKFLSVDPKEKKSAKHVLIMDEVDGMAGNEDRGGVQELISFIKTTEVPIICICNDRQHPKIRNLANYTYDLRFQKPRMEQIRAAMMSICHREGIKISMDELNMLIQATNQDIRQVMNHLALLSAKPASEATSENAKYKNLKLGPWDVVRKVFSREEHKKMNIHEKSDLFFHDYNIAPLFVAENYLSVAPEGPQAGWLDKIADCADSLAMGDVIEKNIRGNMSWSLLPVQACFSSVIPGSVMSGRITGQINFPSWLGKNSRRAKFDRILQDLTVHTRLTTGASKEAINLDYITMLVDKVLRPLVFDKAEGVEASLEAMCKYNLLKEDLEGLVEVSLWPGKRDPMQSIESKVKAAFTRAYNEKKTPTSFTSGGTKKKQNLGSEEFIDNEEEEEQVNNSDEEDKIENDKMIKVKNTKATGSKPKANKAPAKKRAAGPSKRNK